ncbi:MAG: glycoside hydrolase family 130 protein [Saprospiraceae bacterium]
MISIKRTPIRLKADPKKVIIKSLDFGDPARSEPVINFVLGLSEQQAAEQLQNILEEFEHRHYDLKKVFLENFDRQVPLTSAGLETMPTLKKLLIGAYFTHEYSNESAALFNPSIVPHPDQSGLGEGELRFILSLRAVGEGHISSISFQTGIVTADGEVTLDQRADKLSTGQVSSKKAEAQYDLHFSADIPLSGRVLFPQSAAESNGMEDARFVQFFDNGESRYYGTYTAYNGRAIQPHLIETTDFQNFKIRPFQGSAASNKGMALFPEKINGHYAMVGRQGGRNLSIMYADDLLIWDDHQLLQTPQRDWEMLQMGNCGSPIKTDKGWLLLTHAVSAMRKYTLSFTLLDLEHPERVLASLEQPLLSPNAEEREGYVPNVLYTCGLLLHNGNLIIPYAMSDSSISFAVVGVEEVLAAMLG